MGKHLIWYYKYTLAMNLLSVNMEEIADIFIRPSRHVYKPTDLGPKNVVLDDHRVIRHDFEVKNKRNLTLKGSYYSRQQNQSCDNFLIYLHCNSGCRIQGLSYLKLALENDFNYLLFDFSGSGLSEGQYVSLGFHQVQDLDVVIKYVKRHINQEAKFCLWGRSMGAVTALRYLAMNRQSIQLAIFDSPFSSLRKLFLQIGKQRTNFPQILLNMVYKYIKPIIISKADFNIDQVDLDDVVKDVTCPGIFIASKQDSLIPFQQMDVVFNGYKGQKEMFFIDESHNEARNMSVIKNVFKAIRKSFLISKHSALKKQKTSFYGKFPNKDASRKKLELTIKSQSQRILKYNQKQDHIKPQNIMIDLDVLDRTKASCLMKTNKLKREKKYSEINTSMNNSESFIELKRKPLATRHFNGQENSYVTNSDTKPKPKFSGETKIIEIKMKLKDREGMSRQRKTFQNISSKRPPFVELKGAKQFRSSFDLKFRS